MSSSLIATMFFQHRSIPVLNSAFVHSGVRGEFRLMFEVCMKKRPIESCHAEAGGAKV